MPNRVVCSVLDEMRKCYDTQSYGALPGLIHEVQIMVNRMEAALYDQKDLTRLTASVSKLQKEVNALKAEKIALGGKVDYD